MSKVSRSWGTALRPTMLCLHAEIKFLSESKQPDGTADEPWNCSELDAYQISILGKGTHTAISPSLSSPLCPFLSLALLSPSLSCSLSLSLLPSGLAPRWFGLAPRRFGLAPRRFGLAPRRFGLA